MSMNFLKIERVPEGIRFVATPRNGRKFSEWLRDWRNDHRAVAVTAAMADHAIDGALAALDNPNPFTIESQ
jgi:hypothetical protein